MVNLSVHTLKNDVKYQGILFLLLSCLTNVGLGQQKRRVSPLSMVTARYQATYIKVTYGQPYKKERPVFGDLVPFGKVWRTGANEATEITITQDIMVNGSTLKKGTYSLFTIPNKHQWTIIFNTEVGLWGTHNYNPEKDVMRFEVTPRSTKKVYKAFTIDLEDKNDVAKMVLAWDKTKVSFSLQYLK